MRTVAAVVVFVACGSSSGPSVNVTVTYPDLPGGSMEYPPPPEFVVAGLPPVEPGADAARDAAGAADGASDDTVDGAADGAVDGADVAPDGDRAEGSVDADAAD
jgi:hypothetical protein